MKKYLLTFLSLFLLTVSSCHAGTIVHIQDTVKFQNDSFTGSTGTTGSFSVLPKVGDFVIVTISGFRTGGFTGVSVTDNQGNSYHVDVSQQDSGPTSAAVVASAKVTASSDTFTITIKATGTSNAVTWMASEYSGLSGTNWFDKSATAQITSTTGGTVNGNATNQNGELVIGVVGSDTSAANAAFSTPTGFTQSYVENNGSAHSAGQSSYEIATSSLSTNTSWTWTLGSGEHAALVTAVYTSFIPVHQFIFGGSKAYKYILNQSANPITRVQAPAGCAGGSGTSCSVTLAATKANDLIVVSMYLSGAGSVTVTDNASGGSQTYTTDVTQTSTEQVFIKHTMTKSGVTSVTCAPPAAEFVICFAFEYSGIANNPFDKSAHQVNASSASYTSGNTAVISQSNELMIGITGTGNSASDSIVANGGWANPVAHLGNADGDDSRPQELISTTTKAFAATGTNTSVLRLQAAIATYKGFSNASYQYIFK